MKEIKLISFQKKYSKLNIHIQEKFPRIFKLGELIAHNSELSKGYVVDKKVRITEEGTIFSYIKIKNDVHKEEYHCKVKNMQMNLLGEQLLEEIDRYKSLITKKSN